MRDFNGGREKGEILMEEGKMERF